MRSIISYRGSPFLIIAGPKPKGIFVRANDAGCLDVIRKVSSDAGFDGDKMTIFMDMGHDWARGSRWGLSGRWQRFRAFW